MRFFSAQVFETIDLCNTAWHPSRRLLQTTLLLLGMFAWAHSSLSLNLDYLLGSINHGIQRLYHDSDTLTRSSTFSEDIHPSAAPINHASNLLPAPTTVHKSADNNPTKARITLSALPNPLEKNNLDAQKNNSGNS